jgi:hypothetical protein
MGVHHKDGYSATVEGFFVVGEQRVRVAKSNGSRIVLAEQCEVPPGTEGELLVIVDGSKSSRRVIVPSGIVAGQSVVEYQVAAPF